MTRYVCSICSYVYDTEAGDPSSGIEPGTTFKDLPDDWTCPECGAVKDQFEKEEWTYSLISRGYFLLIDLGFSAFQSAIIQLLMESSARVQF